MAARGQHTYAEIKSQPDVWRAVLAGAAGEAARVQEAWRAVSPQQVLFTGCGSTYYLARAAAALLQGMTGVPARGVPASEIALYTAETVARPDETLLVAVSRSGTTTETEAALEKFRQIGGKATWGVTCYPQTPIGEETDLVLLAEAAQEESVAQTRSFSSMLLLCEALAAIAGGADLAPLQRLPDAAATLLAETEEMAKATATRQDLARVFFLGAGPLYGIACEAMLKMKEMSITQSEAYHFLEFRHGPKAMVDDQALVIGLLAEHAFDHNAAVLRECAEMGGEIVALSPLGARDLPGQVVALPEGMPDWARTAAYLPTLQLMAYYRSVHKGLDPDRPRNLTAVIYLDKESLL